MTRLIPLLLLFATLGLAALPHTAAADDSSIEMHAKRLSFDQTALTVSSGANVTITLHNDDVLVAHNIEVDGFGLDPSDKCTGRCTTILSFTAPDPGTYNFFCTTHPDLMKGVLTVQ